MRLWHQELIRYLPRQQLLGQHRECCALRGAGWGRRHSVVNYVFEHPHEWLIAYHIKVMDEMKRRGYHPDETWYNVNWRGNKLGEEPGWADAEKVKNIGYISENIYSEHNDDYFEECLNNLSNKGINLEMWM